jgi:hypothetical protein
MGNFFEDVFEAAVETVTFGTISIDDGKVEFNTSLSDIAGTYISGATLGLLEVEEFGEIPGGPTSTQVNTRLASANLPVVYGRRRTGGVVAFMGTSGELNDLSVVLAISEGECDDSLEQIYYDEEAVIGAGGVQYSQYRSGTDSQSADGDLVNSFPQNWTANHKLNGVAYLVVRLRLLDPDSGAQFFKSLPKINVLFGGKKLLDTRGPTTAVTNNPAWAIRDYLTNSRYGRGVDSSKIDDASFEAAADYFDELVTSYSGGPTHKRYQLSAALDTGQELKKNLQILEQACLSNVVYFGGKYRLIPRKAGSSVFSFNVDNIVGAWSFSDGGKETRANRVKAVFANEAIDFKNDVATVDESTFRADEDGGTLLVKELKLNGVSNYFVARRIAETILKESRLTLNASFIASMSALNVTPGDIVDITHATPGWSAKLFRVLDAQPLGSGLIKFTVREHADSVYDTTAPPERPPKDTDLPDVSNVPAPTIVSIETGTSVLTVKQDGTIISRAKITFQNSHIFTDYVEVQWKKQSEAEFVNTLTLAGLSNKCAFIEGLEEGVVYDFRLRVVNTSEFKSPYAEQSETFLGKSELPGDVPWFSIDGNVLSWGEVVALDLAGYIVKYHHGDNVSWGDGAPLHEGFITTQIYTSDSLPTGITTLMIKAVDTSGNESQLPAVIKADLGDPIVENIIETFDLDALGFPGTITNGTVNTISDDLEADAQTPIMWSDDTKDMWMPNDTVLMWAVTQYAAMTYETSVTPTSAQSGAQMTIDDIIVGEPWQLLYRRNGPSAMWSSDDTTPMWAVDDSVLMWVNAPDFQPWPGAAVALNEQFDFKVTTGQGTTRGIIFNFDIDIDVPDIVERLDDVAIGASGTRLPITETYNNINNVSITLQDDGGTAETVRVFDKDETLGPLVKVFDSSSVAVTGTIDATIQGF